MRKNYIVKILLRCIFIVIGFVSCTATSNKDEHSGHEHQIQYTCPMHPQVIKGTPGQCPVCGMDLVPKSTNKELVMDSNISSLTKPVNKQVVSSISTVKPETGTRIFSVEIIGTVGFDTRDQYTISSRVSGRIEKLFIKYNYQPVKKGQLIMEIYSPDLAAAQRELLFIAHSGDSEGMFQKAKQRLELLGMRSAEIDKLIRTDEIFYKVPVYSNTDGYILEKGTGGDTAVLLHEGQYISAGQPIFTIYHSTGFVAEFALDPQTTTHVKPGQKLLLYMNGNKSQMYTASIGLIEPVYRNNQSFAVARVYLNKKDFKVGQLVTANIPVIYTGGWWVPRKAVWRLGAKSIVFKKGGTGFKPVEVQTSAIVKELVQVKTNIEDWNIASNAYYLVDSESFIDINNNTPE